MALSRCALNGSKALQLCAGASSASSVRFQSGFGQGDNSGGFGGPPLGGFGGPPQGGLGGPPQGGFGGPPQGGFGGLPQGGFGGPPQGGFGGPPQGGFGGPPQGGFGGPPQGGFGGPPQGGFGGPPQGGFGGPPQGGFGGPPHAGFGGPSFYASRRPVETAPIPTNPPFGLHLARIAGITDEDIMEVFAAQKPTKVERMGETNAFIHFSNRDDLVAALERSGTEDVRYMRVSTSMRLKRIAEISLDPPFKCHMRQLPPGLTNEELMELFKEFEPISCLILQNRMTLVPYAFMEFGSRENLMRSLEMSGKSAARHIIINPTIGRQGPQ